jgi:DMSO/TMAO reductase YedYZ molybdopterin-dependent catalytic subunit
MEPSRRDVLGALAAAGVSTLIEPEALFARALADVACVGDTPPGELLGTLQLFRDRPQDQPLGVKYGGRGLDARLATDLSRLEPGQLITPNDRAYIRTEIPAAAADHREPWTIATSTMAGVAGTIALEDLVRDARPMGAHLFECSGNANPSNFGLMSVAEWDGVPFVDVVSRLTPKENATAVLVSGVDHDGQVSERSVPGASWIFPLASVESLGAFLAVRMNGEPLPPDHGRPIRLVVPGWYGCTWIKWMNEIRLVGADEPATSQMIEFAGRTHQTEAHRLARDYAPADIQAAAMPVRVEKRRTSSGLVYRIVGIVWGGQAPVHDLTIRFHSADEPQRFSICPRPVTHRMWSLWEYWWTPDGPGVYDILLRVADPDVPQRRMDSGYYRRQVRIDDV